MKISAKYLDEWHSEFCQWWKATHAEWIESHFKPHPHTPYIKSPLKIVSYEVVIKNAYGAPNIEVVCYNTYPYLNSEVWLDPMQVNYSCTYDREHRYQTRILETIKRKRIR